MDVKTSFLNGPLKRRFMVAQPTDSLIPDIPTKVYRLRELYNDKTKLQRACMMNTSKIPNFQRTSDPPIPTSHVDETQRSRLELQLQQNTIVMATSQSAMNNLHAYTPCSTPVAKHIHTHIIIIKEQVENEHPSDTYVLTMKMEIPAEPSIRTSFGRRPYALSWKPCQGDSLNLPDHRIHKDGDGDASFQLKSDSLPHAHAQTTKTFYKHQDSRIMKAQELKTKTSAQTLIYKIFLQRYQVYQGRLLASFQDDAKYEHVSQDTRSQGGKDDQEARIKI
ncbi:hypothetical protein Tco_1060251 [Tanacetum coccineum]